MFLEHPRDKLKALPFHVGDYVRVAGGWEEGGTVIGRIVWVEGSEYYLRGAGVVPKAYMAKDLQPLTTGASDEKYHG